MVNTCKNNIQLLMVAQHYPKLSRLIKEEVITYEPGF